MHIFGFREKILITTLQLFVNLRAWYTLDQVVPCNLLAPIETWSLGFGDAKTVEPECTKRDYSR